MKTFQLRTLVILAIIFSVAIATPFIFKNCSNRDLLLLDDVSRLNQTRVGEVFRPQTYDELKQVIHRARKFGLQVSLSGKKHSQGGHAFYQGSLHLDMTQFNQVIAFNETEKIIRVQSGITWKQIQDYVNPYGLSVAVMQSSNIFTVGGSLSANAHGRDPRYGPIIETVRSFTLLNADGAIVHVSRSENEELFALAIGGFGLFGVILDVELDLTENHVYEKNTVLLDYKEYPNYVENHVIGSPVVGLHFARLSIDPDSLLRDGYAVTYTETHQQPEGIFHLAKEKHIQRDKLIFALSRNSGWAKGARWKAQLNWIDPPGEVDIISRNNVMRPPIQFLDYKSKTDTDILQEYFIPKNQYVEFIDQLRTIVEDEAINLLSITLRYVPGNQDAFLNYARSDGFAIVLYINQERSVAGTEVATRWTRKLVDAARKCNGSFYLIYQRYPSQKQIRDVYPNFDTFLERKRFYDPQNLFMNRFYDHYLHRVSRDQKEKAGDV